jgi:hypothetical protein
MENQKLHQNTLTSIFKKITSEEKDIALQHKIHLLNTCIVLDKTILKPMEKQLVGRPQKYIAKLLLDKEIKQEARRQMKRPMEKQMKDNTYKLETGKRKGGSTPTILSRIFSHPSWLL